MNWLEKTFELSRGGSRSNVRSMEGLRGFAIFLVFIGHYITFAEFWLPQSSLSAVIADAIHHIGSSGVDLFFVLSGYLIYGSLISKDQNFFRYMKRRVQRIYPVFVVILTIYIALSFVFPGENKIPAPFFFAGIIYVLQNLLLLPGIFSIKPIIAVAWSLSYEMFYYLMIPLLIWATKMRQWIPPKRMLFFGLIAVFWLSCYWITGTHIRLVMFIAGILLHETENHTSIGAPHSALIFTLLIAALGLMAFPIPFSAGPAIKSLLLFIAFFCLCFSCFSNQGSIMERIFSWTPIRWLGNMSYSYYLIHGLVLKAIFMVIGKIPVLSHIQNQWLFWACLPVMFALSLIPAVFLFMMVERPLSLTIKRPMLAPPKG